MATLLYRLYSSKGGQMDTTRRNLLITGAVAMAAGATGALAQRPRGSGDAAATFYEKGPVRIHYEEAGSGFPLLLIAGGGLNSVISGLSPRPLNATQEFKGGDPGTAPG